MQTNKTPSLPSRISRRWRVLWEAEAGPVFHQSLGLYLFLVQRSFSLRLRMRIESAHFQTFPTFYLIHTHCPLSPQLFVSLPNFFLCFLWDSGKLSQTPCGVRKGLYNNPAPPGSGSSLIPSHSVAAQLHWTFRSSLCLVHPSALPTASPSSLRFSSHVTSERSSSPCLSFIS